MSDIDLEELRLGGIPINCKAADEIDRLRSLLKEAGESLEGVLEYVGPFDDLEEDRAALDAAHAAYGRASTVLSKIKGEA